MILTLCVLIVGSLLDEIGKCGEAAGEFLTLYKRMISNGHWKFYLALRGVLPKLCVLINKEIDQLTALEETTLSSDLLQGYSLKALTGTGTGTFIT